MIGVKKNKENLEDKYIKVQGINTRYWVNGNEGTDLILIHGIGSYMEAWENNVEFFSQNHRVFVLDLPGFGQSDKPVVCPSLLFHRRSQFHIASQHKDNSSHKTK